MRLVDGPAGDGEYERGAGDQQGRPRAAGENIGMGLDPSSKTAPNWPRPAVRERARNIIADHGVGKKKAWIVGGEVNSAPSIPTRH